jgi:DNA-binding HxlR family transcriptional regulator
MDDTFHAQIFGGGNCAGISKTLSLVGDKWSVLTIMLLSERPRRFNDIKRTIGNITQRMLTLTLRGLEREGLVKRTVYPTNPPQVEYELTGLGRSLQEPIKALGRWTWVNQDQLEQHRASYDARLAAGEAASRRPGVSPSSR